MTQWNPNAETSHDYGERADAELQEIDGLIDDLDNLDGHDHNPGLCGACGAYLRRGEIESGLCVECEYGGEEYAP